MRNENQKYFAVVTKCGHVGRNHYVPVKFAVAAESRKEAAKFARHFGRVKHDHKDAILSVTEIDYQEFLKIKEINKNDQYLHCKSRYEQNEFCDLSKRIVVDNHSNRETYNKADRKARCAFKIRKNRILEEYDWEADYEYAY